MAEDSNSDDHQHWDTAIKGWVDTQRLDHGPEQMRILPSLNGIPDAIRSLAIGEALFIAQSLLACSGQTTTTR